MKKTEIVAKKYAQACMNVFFDEFSINDFYNMVIVERYLKQRSAIFFFLQLSAISDMVKQRSLERICKQFKLGKPIQSTIKLLIKDKRSFLCADVLGALAELYKERHHIYEFKFIGAQTLSKKDEQQLQSFLAKQTGYDIIYESMVNKELIAGIRLQSDTLLWEYSIHKQLHNIELQFIR